MAEVERPYTRSQGRTNVPSHGVADPAKISRPVRIGPPRARRARNIPAATAVATAGGNAAGAAPLSPRTRRQASQTNSNRLNGRTDVQARAANQLARQQAVRGYAASKLQKGKRKSRVDIALRRYAARNDDGDPLPEVEAYTDAIQDEDWNTQSLFGLRLGMEWYHPARFTPEDLQRDLGIDIDSLEDVDRLLRVNDQIGQYTSELDETDPEVRARTVGQRARILLDWLNRHDFPLAGNNQSTQYARAAQATIVNGFIRRRTTPIIPRDEYRYVRGQMLRKVQAYVDDVDLHRRLHVFLFYFLRDARLYMEAKDPPAIAHFDLERANPELEFLVEYIERWVKDELDAVHREQRLEPDIDAEDHDVRLLSRMLDDINNLRKAFRSFQSSIQGLETVKIGIRSMLEGLSDRHWDYLIENKNEGRELAKRLNHEMPDDATGYSCYAPHKWLIRTSEGEWISFRRDDDGKVEEQPIHGEHDGIGAFDATDTVERRGPGGVSRYIFS